MLMLLTVPETERPKLAAIYARYWPVLFRVAMALLRRPEDAEDAVHRVFVQLAKNRDKLDSPDSLRTKTYLIVAVEHAAFDILKARSRRMEVPLEEDLPGLEVPYSGENALADCILRLPARQRQVILLRFQQGYSQRETANLLGVAPGTVQKTEAQAKENLRNLLKERGVKV